MAVKRYILCVDDEKSVLSSLKQELKANLGKDYGFEIAESGEEALEIVTELTDNGIDIPVVISDQLMPGMKGDQFLIELHKSLPKTRKILLTGQASAISVGNALNNADLFRFLSKPWNPEDIAMTVKQAINVYYLDQKLEDQNRHLKEINRFGVLASQHLGMKEWVRTMLSEIVVLTNATKGVLCLFDQQNAEKQIYAAKWEETDEGNSYQEKGQEYSEEWIPLGIMAKVRMSKRGISVQNAAKSDWAEAPYIQNNVIKSFLSLPIIKTGQLLGIIYLEHKTKIGHFDTDTQDLLLSIIGVAALALDNVLLYASLERRVAQGIHEISEDHDKMRDSIVYASRIQQQFLPPESYLKELFPNAFIIYQPKDVLSGDFYWASEVQNTRVVVVADCTGHGVPGALVSILGLSLIKNLVTEQKITEPNLILYALHREFTQRQLNRTSNLSKQNTVLADGMDISIAAVKANKLTISSARRDVILFKDKECHLIKGDRKSIGDNSFLSTKELAFSTKSFDVNPGDSFYMFSDGYQDQFGNTNKKFTLNRLKNLLERSQSVSLDKQMDILVNRHTIWKKDTPQTDDICIVGVQL